MGAGEQMNKIQFDYFQGMEAEQYSFYRVPKILFTEEYFKTLTCEAKVLYGLMLDRMSLSVKNHWNDKEGKVYIIFTVEEIAELMNCGTQKAVRLLKELDAGVTHINGSGAYSGKEKKVILCVMKKQLYHRAEEIVRQEDSNAFMIISNASEIYGEGYKSYFGERL